MVIFQQVKLPGFFSCEFMFKSKKHLMSRRHPGIFLTLALIIFLQAGCASSESSEATAIPDADAGSAKGYERLTPDDKDKEVLPDIVQRLQSRHYNQIKLDNEFAARFFDAYIDDLDSMHSVFLASDIKRLRDKYGHRLDEELKEGELKAAYEIFNTYQKRRTQIAHWALQQIRDHGLDAFADVKGDIKLDREEEPWPADARQREKLWKQLLKNQIIELQLSHLEDDEVEKRLKQRYKNELTQLHQTDANDAFSTYMDAYTHMYDPHTDYFSPRRMQDFDIDMNLQLQGIGAELRSKHGYPELARLIPGGPAANSGKLQPTDRILAVAEGKDKEFVDVIGMRLDKAVRLIRGEAGTYVRLQVAPQDSGHTRTVTLKREKIDLKDQAARSRVMNIKRHGRAYKIGLITLPSFYNGTTRDVQKQVRKLKSQDVEGIVLDLRNNGGGALGEAMQLIGLFADSAPGVQIQDANGNIQVLGARNKGALYSGPMAVMINRLSASASEIVAGALQDYGRALILGSQTFGKGTVQSLQPLSAGELKLTEAKFYRVSGKSTQARGIVPDIKFPDAVDPDKIGESALDHALPYDKVPPTSYPSSDDIEATLSHLERRHHRRIADDVDFQYLIKRIEMAREQSDKDSVSLDVDKRRQEQDELEDRLLKLANDNRRAHHKKPYKDYEAFKDAQEKKASKRDEGASSTSMTEPGVDADDTDAYQKESGHILLDMIEELSMQDTGS